MSKFKYVKKRTKKCIVSCDSLTVLSVISLLCFELSAAIREVTQTYTSGEAFNCWKFINVMLYLYLHDSGLAGVHIQDLVWFLNFFQEQLQYDHLGEVKFGL